MNQKNLLQSEKVFLCGIFVFKLHKVDMWIERAWTKEGVFYPLFLGDLRFSTATLPEKKTAPPPMSAIRSGVRLLTR